MLARSHADRPADSRTLSIRQLARNSHVEMLNSALPTAVLHHADTTGRHLSLPHSVSIRLIGNRGISLSCSASSTRSSTSGFLPSSSLLSCCHASLSCVQIWPWLSGNDTPRRLARSLRLSAFGSLSD